VGGRPIAGVLKRCLRPGAERTAQMATTVLLFDGVRVWLWLRYDRCVGARCGSLSGILAQYGRFGKLFFLCLGGGLSRQYRRIPCPGCRRVSLDVINFRDTINMWISASIRPSGPPLCGSADWISLTPDWCLHRRSRPTRTQGGTMARTGISPPDIWGTAWWWLFGRHDRAPGI
jgi:hypothetical protein